ncbi:MAG: hypothetical protein CMN98_04785 [Synechococcus sp. NP17]|nr:hypothetical protein [Synechococcus sp. NP17]
MRLKYSTCLAKTRISLLKRKLLSRLLIVVAGKCAQKILVYACIIQVAVELFLLPILLRTFSARKTALSCFLFDKWHFVFRKKIPPAAINFIIS